MGRKSINEYAELEIMYGNHLISVDGVFIPKIESTTIVQAASYPDGMFHVTVSFMAKLKEYKEPTFEISKEDLYNAIYESVKKRNDENI